MSATEEVLARCRTCKYYYERFDVIDNTKRPMCDAMLFIHGDGDCEAYERCLGCMECEWRFSDPKKMPDGSSFVKCLWMKKGGDDSKVTWRPLLQDGGQCHRFSKMSNKRYWD